MKQYYLDRLQWIFTYRSSSFGYCLLKTLCLIVGVPIYAVLFIVEMVLTFVYTLFSPIPVLNVVVMAICKALMMICNCGFWLCILTDIKAYCIAHKPEQIEYEVSDDSKESEDDNDKTQKDKAAEDITDTADTITDVATKTADTAQNNSAEDEIPQQDKTAE